MKTCPTCRSPYQDNLAFCPNDGAVLEWDDGAVVRGKYRILSKIGQGGMGAVYRAQHIDLDRVRALKVLSARLAGDRESVLRFEREARLTCLLDHPNVIRVHDMDRLEDGQPFLVMELIEGRSLEKIIEEEGPISPARTCAIIKQVASALDAAHHLGLIHRDIKPDNIILIGSPPGERVKVLDFGIAILNEGNPPAAPASNLTQQGMVVGTPEYMSPEQAMGARGDALDGRSDIYSLGVTMYRMLTLQFPFPGKTREEILVARVTRAPLPIAEARPDLPIPQTLAGVVMSCLERDPQKRPSSAAALVAALEREGQALTAPQAVSTATPAATVRDSPVDPMPSATAQWRRPRFLLPPAVFVLAAALAVVIWVSRRYPSTPPPGEPHTALAVLYFSNLTHDPGLDWLNHGLTGMLDTNLSKVKGLDVIPARRIYDEIGRAGHKEGTELDSAGTETVARNVGSDAFITGKLSRLSPEQLRLEVQVEDTRSHRVRFARSVNGHDLQEVFNMVDKMTAELAQEFEPSVKHMPSALSIEETSTSNLEAYKHFQQGLDFQRRYLAKDAIPNFQQAIHLDPNFGLAYAHLSYAYRIQGDPQKSQDLWPKVDKLKDHMLRRDYLEFQAYKANWVADLDSARGQLQSLLNEFPRQDEARSLLSEILLYQGDVAGAIRTLEQGLQLDPDDDILLNDLGPAEAAAGNLDGALNANQRYIDVRPNDPNPYDTRGNFLYQFSRDDEAAEAYRKTIALKQDFNEFSDYLKLAVVFADQKKFALADSALQEYGTRVQETGKPYLPVFSGQFAEMRGDMEGARQSYEKAVKALTAAGQIDGAAGALQSLVLLSLLTGEDLVNDLALVRRQHLSGLENRIAARLLAAQGDAAGARLSLDLFAAAHPETKPQSLAWTQNNCDLYAALVRKDAAEVLAAAGRMPDSSDANLRYPRGWAYLQNKDYVHAEQDLRTAILDERLLSDLDTMRSRSPLLCALAHFYLGQVYEANGKRNQAVNEYQEFLSHFESSHARLPQIALAKAALQHSLP